VGRMAKFLETRERRALARSVRTTLRALDGRRLPGASPLNRAAVRPHADLLRALAERLDDPAVPASPYALRHLRSLLDGGGPLYARERANELRPALERCLAYLSAGASVSGQHASEMHAGQDDNAAGVREARDVIGGHDRV
jgi:hypothetical protein